MLKFPTKRPVPPTASVKVPVIGTVIPLPGGIGWANALGIINRLITAAINATAVILFLIEVTSSLIFAKIHCDYSAPLAAIGKK